MIFAAAIGYILLMFYGILCADESLRRFALFKSSRSIEAEYLMVLLIILLAFTLIAIPLRIFILLSGREES